MSMRSGASVSQLLAESSVPVAARMTRELSMRVCWVIIFSSMKAGRASGAGPADCGLKDFCQRPAHRRGEVGIVVRRPVLGAHRPRPLMHVAAAGKLHLQRMNARSRLAEIAGDEAALE